VASIVRYRPLGGAFTGGNRSFEAIDRAFERLFDGPTGSRRTPQGAAPLAGVSANLYETAEAFWVELPMPGVRPDDVEVSVHENALTLKAKREWPLPENAKIIWKGFGQGEWQQRFTLPGEVNVDTVVATLEHGLLRLELPKAEHARPRTIRVNATSNGGTDAGPTE
jgi:HSP20 family protein